MYFIHGGRASGKTTMLIKMSAKTGIPILTTKPFYVRWYAEYAKSLGLKIPEPLLWRNSHLGVCSNSKVLIDNGGQVLNTILRINSGVICEAMVIDSPVHHLTNCFLEDPEAFPAEFMGGKIEELDVRKYLDGLWG